MTDGRVVERAPDHLALGIVLSSAALAVAAVATTVGQLGALLLEVLALAALSVGSWRTHAGQVRTGAPLAAAGGLGVLAAIRHGIAAATETTHVIEWLPGAIGLVLLASAFLPVGGRWRRIRVGAGAVAVGVGLVASGVVRGAGSIQLLAGLVLTVVAWDAAEHAVGLGEQVGRPGANASVLGVHSAWTLGVGGLGVAAAIGVSALEVTGLPILGVGLLLAATVAITTAIFS